MKKLIGLLLVMVMLLTMACCLTACDDGEGTGTTTKPSTTTTAKPTTTTATKLQMSDAEIEETFTALAEKAYRFGFYDSVYELSAHSTAPHMNYMDGKVEAYGKASDGTTLYKKTISIEEINMELAKSFSQSFDFTGVKQGVGDPATYEYKHEGGNFVYYDLEHNLKLEKYTFKMNEYTTPDNITYTISYTVDYATSADKTCEVTVRYYNGAFVILSNLEK